MKKDRSDNKRKLTTLQKDIILKNAELIYLTSFDNKGHRIKLDKVTEDLIRIKIIAA